MGVAQRGWLPRTRAATGGRPYQNDDAVDVVGHDGIPVDLYARIENRQFIPNRLHHPPRVAETRRPALDVAEQQARSLVTMVTPAAKTQ